MRAMERGLADEATAGANPSRSANRNAFANAGKSAGGWLPSHVLRELGRDPIALHRPPNQSNRKWSRRAMGAIALGGLPSCPPGRTASLRGQRVPRGGNLASDVRLIPEGVDDLRTPLANFSS